MLSSRRDASTLASDAAQNRSLLGWATRIFLILVPVWSVGLLSPVPSLLLAVRRHKPADWAAFAGFTVAWMLWVTVLAYWPDEGSGVQFAGSFMLLMVHTVGAALHCALTITDRA